MQILLTILLTVIPLVCSATQTVNTANPVEHYIETHHIPKGSEILFFKADINNDQKPDYFISCDDKSFTNGHLGRIYTVYLYKNDKYIWSHDNTVTLDYDKIIFNDDIKNNYEVPILLIEEDSIWGCTSHNDIVKEFKLMDINMQHYPHAPDIFHSILKKDSKINHPLSRLKSKN